MKTNVPQPPEANEDLVEDAIGGIDRYRRNGADHPYVGLEFNRDLLKNSKYLVLQCFLHHSSKFYTKKGRHK